MRWNMALTRAACSLSLAAGVHAQSHSVARITWPPPGEVATGPVGVQIEIQGPTAGDWLLLDHVDEQEATQIASGSGEIAAGTLVFEGPLALGQHRLELVLYTAQGVVSDLVELVSTAPMSMGWPYQDRLAASPAAFSPMAEGANGEVALARIVDGGRNAINFGELVLLDNQGQALPGWPVALGDLGQALSSHTEPILLRRDGQTRLLTASKTHLLEFDRDGVLRAQAPINGLPLGEPALLPLPNAGLQTCLFVRQLEQTNLLHFDAGLALSGSAALPGLPAWPRPVLGDMDGDGWLDLVLLIHASAGIQVLVENGRSGSLDLLATLPDLELRSATTGDLDGDGVTDLIVAARHSILALTGAGMLWTRSLPDLELGAATLADVTGDGTQETAFLATDAAGAVRFHLLDHLGADEAVSGALAFAHGVALHAPQLARNEGQAPRFLLTVNPDGLSNGSTRFVWMDLQGGVEQPGWLLPGASSGPPRLLDLDADGDLELLAGDTYGRWAVWPTGLRDASPPHPLGDGRHGGISLQPLTSTSTPGLLYGRISLPADFLLPDSVTVQDLALERGQLHIQAGLVPDGRIWVGPGAALALEPGASWETAGLPPVLDVEGLLAIRGDAADVAALPNINAASSTNGLFAGMDLRLRPGARLELSNCILHALAQPLLLDHCRLDLRDSWLLSGAHGVVATGAVITATDCLLQPDGTGLQLLAGSQAELLRCVITSGPGTAIDNQGSQLSMRDCQVLTCQDALLAGAGSQTLLDSVHFQGNHRDLLIAAGHGGVELWRCDFVESHEVGVQNQSSQTVTARNCHWNLQQPTLGPVVREEDSPVPVKPLVIPAPVFRVDPGPMVDGDEPLEWIPVEFSVGGIPIMVEYRIYRSEYPYNVDSPENLVAVTAGTSWRDAEHRAKSFYCVTASFGKQVIR